MAVLAEDGVGSSLKMEDVASMLKRESSFFIGIRSAILALKNLDDFLVGVDPKSVEDLMSEFVASLVEQPESEQVTASLESDCLIDLSKILQEPRIVDFLAGAGKKISETLNKDEGEDQSQDQDDKTISQSDNQKLFYSFIDEYADSSSNNVMAWLTEEAPYRSILLLVEPVNLDFSTTIWYDKGAQNHFDCCYWVDTAGLYKIKKLLQIMEKRAALETRIDQPLRRLLTARRTVAVIDRLINHSFMRNRYMFVFDEVCHQDFWEVMKQALHDNDKWDWIITTFVRDKVFNSYEEGLFKQVRNFGPMPDDHSWELFCRIAFRDEPEWLCPTELEGLSRDIVRKCKGFPLPIVGIAGMLSTREKQVLEWKKVCNSFKLEVKTNLHLPRSIDVSEHDPIQNFPIALRRCYFYFSMFPPNSVIPNDKLLKLWIAEGFIEEKIGKTLEEVSEEYLNELISRSFVQPCQGVYRLEQFCTTYKLKSSANLQDIDGLRFRNIISSEDDLHFLEKSRRLSIYTNDDVDPEYLDPQIHSLFLFDGDRDVSFMVRLIRQCAQLTVLNFEYCPIEYIPDELGSLIHLKYLSLKGTKLRQLPKSVDKLINLQTFDLRETLLLELPSSINKLKNLQHLMVGFFDDGVSGNPNRGVKLNKGIKSLQNLQTLTVVDADRSGIGVINEIAMLRQLRTLGLSRLTAETASSVSKLLGKFSVLKSLTLQTTIGKEVLRLERISWQLPFLQRLVLKGQFLNLPDSIFYLQNLSSLCLSLPQLNEVQMMLLAELPNLASLWLCRAFKGKHLLFKQGSFGKLKLLVLREFRSLKSLEIEDGALPCLEELRIGSSPGLFEVPYGIRFLKNLKHLINYDMPREFVLNLQPDGGFDYWIIKHIPSVFFLYRTEGRKYKIFELGESELYDHLDGLTTNEHHIIEPLNEHEFSLCEGNDDDENTGRLSFSTAHPIFPVPNFKKASFSSSFFTDDVEE